MELKLTMIYKLLHGKLKIEQQEPTKTRGCTQLIWKIKQYLLHYWHPSC